jgi:hypothetical protein
MFYGRLSNVCSNQHHTDQSPCEDRLHRSLPYALGASAFLVIYPFLAQLDSMLLGFVFDMEKPALSSLNLDERAELVLLRNNADRRVAIREFWPAHALM